MSYDDEFQADIQKKCIESVRELKQEESLFYTHDRLIKSIECRQKNCGSLELHTDLNTGLGSFVESSEFHFTDWFSEEPRLVYPFLVSTLGGATCQRDYFVTKIYCAGPHCDNKQLLCHKLKSSAGVMITDTVVTSGWITSGEYTPEMKGCPTDHYLIGIECKGGWCKSIRLKCREIKVRKT